MAQSLKNIIEYKFILLGDSAVGKSSIFIRLSGKGFIHEMQSTIGTEKIILDFDDVEIDKNEGIYKDFKITLFDTAGQERYRSITKTYFKDSQGIILIYNIIDPTSFEHVQIWLDSIKESLSDWKRSGYLVMLLGNKLDIAEENKEKRQVLMEEAEKLCKDIGLYWGGECSAKTFDDASLKDGFGYYPYDVEGTRTSKNQLVKNGELVSMLSSRETAAKFGRKSSGNARSSISDQPIVRMSNTYLEPGDMSFDELLEDVKDGIYLKGSRGGQVDTGKGNFQFNATEAYKIENGELKDHYRDVSLSGNILETLRGVDAIGSDFKLSVGFCGKDGQTAPVGDGGPHTKILNAMVGGSS